LIDAYFTALGMIFDPSVLVVILIAAVYGLFVGAIPGLSATMATALLVPVTFFMPPVPAVAAIITTAATAIYAGDIPGFLLRIPGTPASAAYVDEGYRMTQKGEPGLALGTVLLFSAFGGLFGTAFLMFAAPSLADFALSFGSVEFFWIMLLGLSAAVFIGAGTPLKAIIMLLFGLLFAFVGMNNPAAVPRFTMGSTDLLAGISLIPMIVGMFAVSEVLRYMVAGAGGLSGQTVRVGKVFSGVWTLAKRYPVQAIRGSVLGTGVGMLPGAGADIAAWLSYATSKRFSKEPRKFGTGHPEGLVEAGASNNSAVGSAWIPALVFGIPGDTITAIAIGVLYMKNMNPGPGIFIHSPENVYALFLVFILANLLLIPLGWLMIKLAANVLKMPRDILMPAILILSIMGSFAINNSLFDVGIMLAFGLFAFFMEENGFPLAPAILGVVLGAMLETRFINSMIMADGNLLGLVSRPIAAVLAGVTITLVVWSVVSALRSKVADVAPTDRP
jgi:putative tricarboxylic transport membrane protein